MLRSFICADYFTGGWGYEELSRLALLKKTLISLLSLLILPVELQVLLGSLNLIFGILIGGVRPKKTSNASHKRRAYIVGPRRSEVEETFLSPCQEREKGATSQGSEDRA